MRYVTVCAVFVAGAVYSQAPDVAKIKADAEAGNAMAQAQYAQLLQTGNGVEKNESEAVKWYQKAAEAGNGYAQVNLGVFYQTGVCGLKQDLLKAKDLYEKASAQGNSYAQFYLGRMYDGGVGVTKDVKKAVELYRKAAIGGMPAAQSCYAISLTQGVGVPRDIDEALKWCEKALKSGDGMSKELHPLIVAIKTSMDAENNARDILEFITLNDISINRGQQDAIRDLYDGQALLFRHVNVWHNNHGSDEQGSRRLGMEARRKGGRGLFVYGNFSGTAKDGIRGIKEGAYIDVFGIVRKGDNYGSEYGVYLEAIPLDGKTDIERIQAFLKKCPLKKDKDGNDGRLIDRLALKTDLNPLVDAAGAAKIAAARNAVQKKLLAEQKMISKEKFDEVLNVAKLAENDALELLALFCQSGISMNRKQAETVAEVYSGRYLLFSNVKVWHNNHGTDGNGSKRIGMSLFAGDGPMMFLYGNFSGEEKNAVRGIKSDSRINVFGKVSKDNYGSEYGVYLEALVLDGKTDAVRISRFLDATGFDGKKHLKGNKGERVVDKLAAILDLDPPKKDKQ